MIVIPENKPWTKEGYDARCAALERRYEEIEPLLSKVVVAAAATHHLLEPHAKHVSKVPRDYPIRYAGSVALTPFRGFSDTRDIHIFARLGAEHRLTIRKDLRNDTSEFPLYEITRYKEIDDKLYHETKITHYRKQGCFTEQPYQAQASRWKYGYVGGDKHCGDTVDEIVSGYSDGWLNLENYLADVHNDLRTAESLVGQLS